MDNLVESIIAYGLYPAVVILNEYQRAEDYESCAIMRDAIKEACVECEIDDSIAFREDSIEFLYNAMSCEYGEEVMRSLPQRIELFRNDITDED